MHTEIQASLPPRATLNGAAAVTRALAKVGAWMVAVTDRLQEMAEYRRQLRHLATLDDRALTDLGLSRGDVYRAAGYRDADQDPVRSGTHGR